MPHRRATIAEHAQRLGRYHGHVHQEVAAARERLTAELQAEQTARAMEHPQPIGAPALRASRTPPAAPYGPA